MFATVVMLRLRPIVTIFESRSLYVDEVAFIVDVANVASLPSFDIDASTAKQRTCVALQETNLLILQLRRSYWIPRNLKLKIKINNIFCDIIERLFGLNIIVIPQRLGPNFDPT